MRKLGCITYDELVHHAAELLGSASILWRRVPAPEGASVPEGIATYYAEERLYVVRDARRPVARFGFVKARSPWDAAKKFLEGEAGEVGGPAAARPDSDERRVTE